MYLENLSTIDERFVTGAEGTMKLNPNSGMDKPIIRKNRWVCPNDRYLAMRSKMNAGWSQKTQLLEKPWGEYLNSSASSNSECEQSLPLTEDERQAIIQVINRADIINQSEKERVGRLVDRLDNMKQNVYIATSVRSNERRGCGRRCSRGDRCVCSCAMCGEKFGAVLGTSANLCKNCGKYVCQKCCIEVTIINPQEGSRGNDGNSVFSRIARLAQERMNVQKIVQRFQRNTQKQYLCRICVESMEVWKKSGAWFYKSIPEYVLPEKKEPWWSRPGHKTSTYMRGGRFFDRSIDPQNSTDTSSDDDATRRMAITHGHSALSTNASNREITPTKSSLSSPMPSGRSSPRSPQRRPNSRSPSGYRKKSPNKLDKSCASIASQCNRVSPTGSIGTFRSRANSRSGANGLRVEQKHRVSFENVSVDDEEADDDNEGEDCQEARKNSFVFLSRSKGSQVQSLRLKTPTTSPLSTSPTTPIERFQNKIFERSVERDANRSDEASSSSRIRKNSQVEMPKIQTSEAPGQDYGTLEVSLRYDPSDQCLHCKVIRARNLKPMDIQDLADPFCKLNILPVEKATTTRLLRTKTVHKTLNPEFNEMVNFYGTTETDISDGKALHVLISQDDSWGQDFLGEARFLLQELQPYETKRYKVRLQAHYQVDNEEEIWGMSSSGQGQIQISLYYCTTLHVLSVTVHSAMNLLPVSRNGFSDPFVKLALVDNQRCLDYSTKKLSGKKTTSRSSKSTSIKRKTLNPVWNEEFIFTIPAADMMKFTLCLSVWNKDFGKDKDYLGGLMLGYNSKGARLRHWKDAMEFPNNNHTILHNLANQKIAVE